MFGTSQPQWAVSVNPARGDLFIEPRTPKGFVNYEKYCGFTLTDEGRAVANHIKVRHHTLTELFQLLGLSPETVEQKVEVIEHHLRLETLHIFSRLVRFWRRSPKTPPLHHSVWGSARFHAAAKHHVGIRGCEPG